MKERAGRLPRSARGNVHVVFCHFYSVQEATDGRLAGGMVKINKQGGAILGSAGQCSSHVCALMWRWVYAGFVYYFYIRSYAGLFGRCKAATLSLVEISFLSYFGAPRLLRLRSG